MPQYIPVIVSSLGHTVCPPLTHTNTVPKPLTINPYAICAFAETKERTFQCGCANFQSKIIALKFYGATTRHDRYSYGATRGTGVNRANLGYGSHIQTVLIESILYGLMRKMELPRTVWNIVTIGIPNCP